MSKTKQTDSEIHAKAMEDFFKRGGKVEHIETGKSGQVYKSPSQVAAAKQAAAAPTPPATPAAEAPEKSAPEAQA